MLAVLSIAAAAPDASGQVFIDGCNQTVPARLIGVVQTDVSCPSGAGTVVVTIEDRGTLDLAAHVLSGAETGILCRGRCTITSTGAPGTIRNAVRGISGIPGVRNRMKLDNLQLEDHAQAAIVTDTDDRLRGFLLTILGGTSGVQGGSVRVEDFVVAGTSDQAVSATRVRLQRCSITDSGGDGVEAERAKLRDCTVTGNGTATTDPVDIRTVRRPAVKNTVCDHSRQLAFPFLPWDVCVHD